LPLLKFQPSYNGTLHSLLYFLKSTDLVRTDKTLCIISSTFMMHIPHQNYRNQNQIHSRTLKLSMGIGDEGGLLRVGVGGIGRGVTLNPHRQLIPRLSEWRYTSTP